MPIFLLATVLVLVLVLVLGIMRSCRDGGMASLQFFPFGSFHVISHSSVSFMSDIRRWWLYNIHYTIPCDGFPFHSFCQSLCIAAVLPPTPTKNTKGLLSKRWFVCLILIIRVSMQILLIIPEEMVDSNWIGTWNHSAGKRRLTSCERVRVTLNRIRSVEKGKDHLRRYRRWIYDWEDGRSSSDKRSEVTRVIDLRGISSCTPCTPIPLIPSLCNLIIAKIHARLHFPSIIEQLPSLTWERRRVKFFLHESHMT